MPPIFINYRREDSAAHAGRIYDRLRDRFGSDQVFRDIDAITPGAKFPKAIFENIDRCNSLVAIIGKTWLNTKNEDGKRRLDDPNDWVKSEIREALARGKLVIPALVNGAHMPKKSELPAEIAELASHNAIEISESRFDFDIDRLISAIRGESRLTTSPYEKKGRPNSSIVEATLGAVVTGNNLTIESEGIINTGSNNIFNIGISIEKYEAELKSREHQLRAEFLSANVADKVRIALLEKELEDVDGKRQNLELSLAKYKCKLAGAMRTLEELRAELPTIQLAQAQEELWKGNSAAAEILFENISKTGKEQAAKAASQLAELAYNRVDYARAYEHYLDALKIEPENATYLNEAGHIAGLVGLYDDAQSYLENALVIREKNHGLDSLDVAQSLHNLATIFHEQGKYTQAESLYKRGLSINENLLGNRHQIVAKCLNNLASFYLEQGDYTRSEPLFLRALEIRENSIIPDFREIAESLNNLASLYRAQGKFANAQKLFQRALDFLQSSTNPNHPSIAGMLSNLAGLFRAQGQYAMAEPLYQRALQIYELAYGGEHPEVATIMNNLAGLCEQRGDLVTAEALYLRALKVREQFLGSSHSKVATTLSNLALLYDSRGRYDAAEPLHKRALEVHETAFGREHPAVATDINNLAAHYDSRGDYVQAETLYKDALDIREKCFDPHHPSVAESLNNLAVLYCHQDQYAKAKPLCRRALNIYQQRLPVDHPRLADIMQNYALILQNLGHKEAARKWQKRAEAVRNSALSRAKQS